MTARVVLTDLDGTMLEPGGAACTEVRSLLARMRRRSIPVCPVTSKTVAEMRALTRRLGLWGPASFENGAGIVHGDGTVEFHPAAIPVARLVTAARRLRAATGAPLRTMFELDDADLAALTGLRGAALAAARDRRATLPLVIDATWDDEVRAALPRRSRLRAVRGNRFLHLQGRHDKGDAVRSLVNAFSGRDGTTIACGDSPNDAEMLARADVAVIVPGAAGPHPELLARFPRAVVAPFPHGRGWAAALRELLAPDLRGAAARGGGRGRGREGCGHGGRGSRSDG